MSIQGESSKFSAAFGAAFLFGVGFNWITAWLGRRGYSEGYTAVLVIIGTGITILLAAPIIGLVNALKVFGLFAASGAPMALGDMGRHAQARRKFEQLISHGR